jgi:hypothetical protein
LPWLLAPENLSPPRLRSKPFPYKSPATWRFLGTQHQKNHQKTIVQISENQLIGSGAWFTLIPSLNRPFGPFPLFVLTKVARWPLIGVSM